MYVCPNVFCNSGSDAPSLATGFRHFVRTFRLIFEGPLLHAGCQTNPNMQDITSGGRKTRVFETSVTSQTQRHEPHNNKPHSSAGQHSALKQTS